MHREVLTEPAAKLFPLLRRFPDFYLAGGTALALHIGHRVSVDFDLFSGDELDRTLLGQVRGVFGSAEISPLVNNARRADRARERGKGEFYQVSLSRP
jgi:hypothetical protein